MRHGLQNTQRIKEIYPATYSTVLAAKNAIKGALAAYLSGDRRR